MEERNVKLTLEKAKEWYKIGGELKEIALQAFDEKELKTTWPINWKDFCDRFLIDEKECFIENTCTIVPGFAPGISNERSCLYDKNLLPSKEYAEAFLAFMKLISIRKAMIEDWKPNWDDSSQKFCIVRKNNKSFIVAVYSHYPYALSFPKEHMANYFITNFIDLLNKASILL